MYKRAFFLILMQKKQHNLLFLDNFIKYTYMNERKIDKYEGKSVSFQ